jgi:iron complex transport system substrate-binding protein
MTRYLSHRKNGLFLLMKPVGNLPIQEEGRVGFTTPSEIMKKPSWKKICCSILVLALIGVPLAGCGPKIEDGTYQEEKNQNETFPLTIEDQMGREIVIEKSPERLVSLSPSNTEILFDLGLGDKLFGVTDYCDYPEEAKSKEKIGGFADPSIEKIVSLKPDLVFATNMHQQAVEQLEKLGIPSLVLDPGNMEEMLQSIELMGTAAGVSEKAKGLAEELRSRIKAVTDGVDDGIPEEDKPRVYYEIWPSPITTAGPGTFVDDIIRLSGGVNIASDAKQSYPEYSQEMIVAKNPEIIVFSHHGSSEQSPEDILGRAGWESIDAIKEKNVFYINEDIMQLATPRLVDGLEEFAQLLRQVSKK